MQIVVQGVDIGAEPSFPLWPYNDNVDLASYNDIVEEQVYRRGDVEILVRSRRYWAYSPYIELGANRADLPMPPGYVHALNAPRQEILDRMLADLEARSREGAKTVLWRHSYQCYPAVAQHLKRLFRLSILKFGDDCPGGTEVKTFPVAPYFDALLYNMLVRTYGGRDTAEEYREHGLPYAKFIPIGMGCAAQYVERNPDAFDRKLAMIRAGSCPIGLVYLGARVGSAFPHRRDFQTELNARAGELDREGITTRLMGYGPMRDGVLTPEHYQPGCGLATGDLYHRSLFTVNVAASSIFNARLFECAELGAVQIIHDHNLELARFGFIPGEHYIPFDQTVTGLLQTVRAWRPRREETARIALQARDAFRSFLARQDPMGDTYFDHVERLR